VGGGAELAVLRGDVRIRVHTEGVVGILGRGATNRADGVWEGGGMDMKKIRCEGLHIRSGEKGGLIPRGVRDGISEKISRSNLGHCKGEVGDALERRIMSNL